MYYCSGEEIRITAEIIVYKTIGIEKGSEVSKDFYCAAQFLFKDFETKETHIKVQGPNQKTLEDVKKDVLQILPKAMDQLLRG